MKNNKGWRPKEIIIHKKALYDTVTSHILRKCSGVSVESVDSGKPNEIIQASPILSKTHGMLPSIHAGKQVLYIAPPGNVIDDFNIDDDRLKCPHFKTLKLASNGCHYNCDWCFLKLTYRAQRPFITVRVGYDKILSSVQRYLKRRGGVYMFNTGELADSLSLEHLTKAMKFFVPEFGKIHNGYLFLLTKSTKVNGLLDLKHNGHTIIAWSVNAKEVSKRFEVGAPSLKARLKAAAKVQDAGYPLRLRLDPIVPIDGWKQKYRDTVQEIFDTVSPGRITLGTLRFEKGMYNQRNTIFSTGDALPEMVSRMEPMFEPKLFQGRKQPSIGKMSFPEDERFKIFDHVINEIVNRSSCSVALCKESEAVWNRVGLDLSQCRCVCQYYKADMS